MAKKFILPQKKSNSYVKLTGFFYYADTLKVKEGRHGKYVSFCLVQEQKGERGMKKVYLPVRFFSEVDKIETINLLSYIEIEGFLSSYFGMFIKGSKIRVLEESTVQPEIPTFSVKLTDDEMVAAVLRDCERNSTMMPSVIPTTIDPDDGDMLDFNHRIKNMLPSVTSTVPAATWADRQTKDGKSTNYRITKEEKRMASEENTRRLLELKRKREEEKKRKIEKLRKRRTGGTKVPSVPEQKKGQKKVPKRVSGLSRTSSPQKG